MSRIFVSHSDADSVWCDSFVSALAKYNLDIWYDKQGLKAGVRWLDTIEEEIRNRDIFIVILSPNAIISHWVRQECALAMLLKKRIISVIHIPVKVDGFLAVYQFLNLPGLDPSQAAAKVISDIPNSFLPTPQLSPLVKEFIAKMLIHNVTNIQIISTMITQGEKWLTLALRRLKYLEKTGLSPNNYEKWCLSALGGAYDSISEEQMKSTGI